MNTIASVLSILIGSSFLTVTISNFLRTESNRILASDLSLNVIGFFSGMLLFVAAFLG